MKDQEIMSIFFTEQERTDMRGVMRDRVFSNLYWGLLNRVGKYSSSPGLGGGGADTEYWHHAAEYLADAAFAAGWKPSPQLNNWVRSTTLDLARMPLANWIGPAFREHSEPPKGHLETTHLTIAAGLALDLAPHVFTEAEKEELRSILRSRSLPLCREWLEHNHHLTNWRCILLAGCAVSAAILDDAGTLEWVAEDYKFCLEAIQEDGSYGESLQYSNYCSYGLMMIYEALTRRGYRLDMSRYGRAVHWFCHSLLYRKPLAGWGEYPRPRSVNFNDSAALFGAAPDLLTHISRHLKDSCPLEAGLSTWMFKYLYSENPGQGPFDRATFGFLNRHGFMALVNYSAMAALETPAGLPLSARFDNGHACARSDWGETPTVLAMSTSGEAMNTTGHLHGDLNSIILAYRKERLLADAGHSCYRNLIHKLERATSTHNTCTFVTASQTLEQQFPPPRWFDQEKKLQLPVRRQGRFLLAMRRDEVTVFGNDAAEAYGDPIEEFTRFAILCGENVVFVVDRIVSAEPVITHWHWLFNNRDGELEFKNPGFDRIVVRRGNVGMKWFNLHSEAVPGGESHGYIHDAYHPLPGRHGEGRPGSGLLFRWQEKKAMEGQRTVIHAGAMDEYGPIADWHLRKETDLSCALEGPNASCNWHINAAFPKRIVIEETVTGRQFSINCDSNGRWTLS
jgi:hypothetical protein